MADIIREAGAIWKGDLRSGQGHITAKSGVLRGQPYSFGTRFEQATPPRIDLWRLSSHALKVDQVALTLV